MKHTLTVVPLGPGDPALLTLRAADLLRSGIPVVFRTSHHPVAAWLTEQGFPFSSLDALYESAEDFDAMNHAMVQSLLERVRHGDLLYAVPDPLSDRSVSLLLREAAKKADVRVLPGVSLVDTGLAACRGQLDQSPYQTVSAADFSAFPWNPSLPLLITELDSQLLAGEVKLKLNEMLEDQTSVFLLPPSGGAAPVPLSIPLWELDRRKRYDQTVSLLVPGLDYLHRRRFRFEDLVEIMSRLRGRDGCPWDADQTHLSLRPYLVEEAWEAVDAIDHEDMDHLADELGDVLLQVVFHASIGASFDEFTCTDVMTNICRKMMQRHPQLFQEAAVLPDSLREPGQSLTWEEMKQRETGSRTPGESLNDVSTSLPSLKYAMKISKKLASVQAFRRETGAVTEEIARLSTALCDEDGCLREETMARLLYDCMELCRLQDRDGEILLHRAVTRLKEAYQQLEAELAEQGLSPALLSRAEMESRLAGLLKNP